MEELPSDKLEASEVEFKKGEYQWEVIRKDNPFIYQFRKDGVSVHSISAAADQVKSSGLAASVRAGGEADATLTLE